MLIWLSLSDFSKNIQKKSLYICKALKTYFKKDLESKVVLTQQMEY